MNFDEAIKAHTDWKLKLSTYLRHPDKSIDPNNLGHDDHCNLGKWLHGEGKSYASHSEYKELLTAHAQFHKYAADIVRRADRGESVKEDTALGSSSEFTKNSQKVVGLLMKLKHIVK